MKKINSDFLPIENKKSDSTEKVYSCDYVNKFGKKLWSGSFTSDSITVPDLSNYNFIAVNVGGAWCFGNVNYGIGGAGGYGSYTCSIYSYRFRYNNNTLTIDDINKGGSNGSTNVAVTAIYGLF